MIEFLKTYIVPFGFRLVLAIVILIVGFALAKGLSKALGKSNALSKADPNAQNLIVNLVKTAIRVLTVLTAVMVLGVPQSSVIAVLGSCGLAIGLALQGGLSNIAAGLVIMICKPFPAAKPSPKTPGRKNSVTTFLSFKATISWAYRITPVPSTARKASCPVPKARN